MGLVLYPCYFRYRVLPLTWPFAISKIWGSSSLVSVLVDPSLTVRFWLLSLSNRSAIWKFGICPKSSLTQAQYTVLRFSHVPSKTEKIIESSEKLFNPKTRCEVGTVGKISDCQPGGPGFNPRPGRGLNLGRPSFATLSVDRDVKPLVLSLNVLSRGLKEPTQLSIGVGYCRCCGQCPRLVRTEWPC